MIRIKKEHRGTVIGFNNSGAPLKDRSQEDLIHLAIMAIESGQPSLLQVFETPLPKVSKLKAMKMAGIERPITTPTKRKAAGTNEGKEQHTEDGSNEKG